MRTLKVCNSTSKIIVNDAGMTLFRMNTPIKPNITKGEVGDRGIYYAKAEDVVRYGKRKTVENGLFEKYFGMTLKIGCGVCEDFLIEEHKSIDLTSDILPVVAQVNGSHKSLGAYYLFLFDKKTMKIAGEYTSSKLAFDNDCYARRIDFVVEFFYHKNEILVTQEERNCFLGHFAHERKTYDTSSYKTSMYANKEELTYWDMADRLISLLAKNKKKVKT